jgi:hypothetical protein
MRMTADALDLATARLEEIQAEEERLRAELRQQVEEFAFTPTTRRQVEAAAGHFLSVHADGGPRHRDRYAWMVSSRGSSKQ